MNTGKNKRGLSFINIIYKNGFFELKAVKWIFSIN